MDTYIIQTDELALAEQVRLRAGAEQRGKQLLLDKKLINSLGDAICRDADYVNDFVPAATRVGLAGWLTVPLAAVGTAYSVFANNVGVALVPIVPNRQVWVFYKASVLTAGDPVTMLAFFMGVAAIPIALFDLENTQAKLSADGYFSTPIVYEPQDSVAITVRARLAPGVGVRVKLGALICEPSGNTLAIK